MINFNKFKVEKIILNKQVKKIKNNVKLNIFNFNKIKIMFKNLKNSKKLINNIFYQFKMYLIEKYIFKI